MYASEERSGTTSKLGIADPAERSDRTEKGPNNEPWVETDDGVRPRIRPESRPALTAAGLYDELLRRLALRGHAWE